jgi:cell division protein FtsB
MMPAERWALQEQIQALQDENRRLTAANVDLLHGRAA